MSLTLYRFATTVGAPLVRALLAMRMRAGKEDPERFSERLGTPSVARPPGGLIWIHAASVGESMSMLSLIARLRRDHPELNLLLTTGTVTSARIMADRLPQEVLHQYLPVDRIAWVRRFLDHWRPDLVLWVESEFWPNFLCEIGARDIPAVLVNARISPTSFAGWRRRKGMIGRLLSVFTFCTGQAKLDCERLKELGAADVRMPGNLKFAAEPLPVDEAALAEMQNAVGDRPRWLAASTHPGEEDTIAEAHRRLAARHGQLLTIIVPRHVGRAGEIADGLRRDGFTVALRSAGDPPDAEFYIADTMGELGLFYRLAPVVFMGGTLVHHGGQNLLEAARLGCAVIHGPDIFNFRDVADEMRAARATAGASDADGIAKEVDMLLSDSACLRSRAEAARRIAEEKHDILDRIMDELAPCLDALDDTRAPRYARA